MSRTFTFIDLFAGAGGFSEGLLQAVVPGRRFEFLLASDINENCELTHLARYNEQLGMRDVEFLRKSITDTDFVETLVGKLKGREVDVVCGGPPCQSFSLAGRRRKHDKKDDLFAAYLGVIRRLRPKYFIMENVLGILTKEGGAIRENILEEINSIIDTAALPRVLTFLVGLRDALPDSEAKAEALALRERLAIESPSEKERVTAEIALVDGLERAFKKACSAHLDYHQSKTDVDVSTVRHGLKLLANAEAVRHLRKSAILLKSKCDIDNDNFVADFDQFITTIDRDEVVERIGVSLRRLASAGTGFQELLVRLDVLSASVSECLARISKLSEAAGLQEKFVALREVVQLYRINRPLVVNASDFGVPQDRRRVLFIGCRRDQPFVDAVPPTVTPDQKVTIFEALWDLDFLDNGEESEDYRALPAEARAAKEARKKLIRKRALGGSLDKEGKTYADWSREGRLSLKGEPFYVRSGEELAKGVKRKARLHNHQASFHNDLVTARLQAIIDAGGYDRLDGSSNQSLKSKKRDYNLLNPDGQAPTVVTLSDDFVHYRFPRAPTVRELARLQSFDDSFVFQGKRTTGGDRRKDEVPQQTLVGNAVPPLLARAVGEVVLKALDVEADGSSRESSPALDGARQRKLKDVG